MHVIVPFAAPPGPSWPHGLRLPNLAALLARSGAKPGLNVAAAHTAGAEAPAGAGSGAAAGASSSDDARQTLSPPHERALAQALGLPGGDGTLPWAAWRARVAGLPGAVSEGSEGSAWGLVTPCHWQLGTEQVSMLDPALLALDASAAHELLEAVRPLFEDEGFALTLLTPTEWLIAHDSLDGLPCASPDRVIGRNVDLWLGADARARRLRRLQSEVQMLLHAHPLNAAREAQGDLPVNSFWLSGCGRLPAGWQAVAEPLVADGLRAAALAGDADAWAAAFEVLDAQTLGALLAACERGEPVRLTLCGEARAVDLQPMGGARVAARAAEAAPWWRRLAARWRLGPAAPRDHPKQDELIWLATL